MFMYTVRPYARILKCLAEPRSPSHCNKTLYTKLRQSQAYKRKPRVFYARGQKSLQINNLHSGYFLAPVIGYS